MPERRRVLILEPATVPGVPSTPVPSSRPPLRNPDLATIHYDLEPDNLQTGGHFTGSSQPSIQAGVAYDYAFPTWTRHWLLNNLSASKMFYWFDNPGQKALPAIYYTLTGGQPLTEESVFHYLSLMAVSTATDQGWELRFEGRE